MIHIRTKSTVTVGHPLSESSLNFHFDIFLPFPVTIYLGLLM